ncbi:MAG TPA: molybdopterin-dependent oxidoreductase [Gammaproteobacteria bacterium]|nr:molybdopterin-dependent oxidoreductase [Gammaproteobacteria bacterium]
MSAGDSKRILTTRRALVAGGLAAAGAAALGAAARVAGRRGLIPPDYGGVYGVGETLTYAAQRLLVRGASLAREFPPEAVSKVAPVNGDPPQSDEYLRLLEGGFVDWRLAVDGLVARPSSFSLEDLRRLPVRSQITALACEEGWSYIAEWTGAALSDVLAVAGVLPQARYVVFFPYDEWWDSLDMQDALHPQTLVAYGMNKTPLSAEHGAPVRLRVPRQLGYKSFKYLARMTLTDRLDRFGTGQGSAAAESGYSWYAGI